ncbi:hypothetical protein [Massilia rubra]|uniref:Uncharacterized protein n=1 Tax=Massilia rubra TaxID=2607910 RepID=A0ABX0LJ11_9BURK|nr:hypothetical protein [Massilia rubra]NHZ34272.1 hypothetical protein [Massilia rubra]
MFEEYVTALSGDDEAITWEEIQNQVATIDLRKRLTQLEKNEHAYQLHWDGIFRNDIKTIALPGVRLSTLHLAEIPWAVQGQNRVDRFEFERAFVDCCQIGVCAYLFVHPGDTSNTITVLHTPETFGRFDAMDLALAGVKALGGSRFGPSGGSGRGEVCGLTSGDADEVFDLIAARLGLVNRQLWKSSLMCLINCPGEALHIKSGVWTFYAVLSRTVL